MLLRSMAGSAGTRMCLAASGLNNGVLQYCKNNVQIRLRSPVVTSCVTDHIEYDGYQ